MLASLSIHYAKIGIRSLIFSMCLATICLTTVYILWEGVVFFFFFLLEFG